MRIALAADHAGYQLKDELAAWLREAGHEVRAGLLNDLPQGQNNDEQRTRAIAKAVCASVVGSAAMLIQ